MTEAEKARWLALIQAEKAFWAARAAVYAANCKQDAEGAAALVALAKEALDKEIKNDQRKS